MKVALVHDYLKEYGGAEMVVEALLEIWPDAPVYTTVFLPEFAGPHKKKVEKWDVRTTPFQHLPLKGKLLSPFRFIAPLVFKMIDLSEYDVVIVSAAGTYTSPNFIKTGNNSVHICYCHTPPRYLYGYPVANPWEEVMWRRILKFFGQVPMHFLRMIDFKAAQIPDYFIANSNEVAARIDKFYRRDAQVIHPPVDIPKLDIEAEKESFYLTGGRLTRHKGQALAVEACTKLGLPLKVFGGSFASYGVEDLKKLAGPEVEFLGEVTDKEKWELFSKAKALLFPSEYEDFGIMPVEAMAAGTPVIALGQGGVLETVIDGVTGVLFYERSVESLIEAIEKFEKVKWDREKIAVHAQKFSKERFIGEIRRFVEEQLQD